MKNPFRNTVIVALGISYLAAPVPHLHAQPKETAAPMEKKDPAPTAASLVADMKKAVAFTAKSAKDKVSIKSKEARPFWDALKDTGKALDQLEQGVAAHDARMLTGLDALGLSSQQLAASWSILDGSHEGTDVKKGIVALSKAYDTYLLHFGPSVARKKMGGDITEDEKAQLVAARDEVSKLKPQLAAMEAKAKEKSYQRRMARDLQELCGEMEKISGDDLPTYCKYLYHYNRLKYTVGAYNALIDAWYPDYAKEVATAAPSAKSVGRGFSRSEEYYKGWDYTKDKVKHSKDYHAAVEVISSISTEEESTYESYAESYSEESATEESAEESSEINEEVSVDESEDETLAEEVDGEEDIGDSDDGGMADEGEDDAGANDSSGGEESGGDEGE